jgi:adenylosuccinate lyase
MNVWKGEDDFRALLMKDADVMKLLSEKDLDELFDVKYFLRHVDAIYKRFYK